MKFSVFVLLLASSHKSLCLGPVLDCTNIIYGYQCINKNLEGFVYLSNTSIAHTGSEDFYFRLSLAVCRIVAVDSTAFVRYTSTTELNLSGNLIAHLDEDVFKPLTGLSTLFLYENALTILHPNVFAPLVNLGTLSLDDNHLDLSGLVLNNVSVSTLSMDRNNKDLSAYYGYRGELKLKFDLGKLFNLNKLEELELRQNHIKNISDDIFEPYRLRRIDLSHNNLTSVPPSFGDDSILEEVYLQHNRIRRISPTLFENATNMIWLDLSHNELQKIPVGFLDNCPMKAVNFGYNLVREFPRDLFRGCFAMKILHLDGNRLESVGANAFEGMSDLRAIDLSHNNLANISVDALSTNHQKLKIFRASSNRLVSLPEELFFKCPDLEQVDLSHNLFAALPTFLFLHNLKLTLADVSNNKLNEMSIYQFYFNKKLERLDVSDNELKSIHSDLLAKSTDLKYLDVSNNDLETFPFDALQKAEHLDTLNLHNNRLKDVSPGIFAAKSLSTLYLTCNDISILPLLDQETFTARLQLYLPGWLRLHLALNPLKCGCVDAYFALEKYKLIINRVFFSDGLYPTCVVERREKNCDAKPIGEILRSYWGQNFPSKRDICDKYIEAANPSKEFDILIPDLPHSLYQVY